MILRRAGELKPALAQHQLLPHLVYELLPTSQNSSVYNWIFGSFETS